MPVQVPFEATSAWPSPAVPAIVGSAVLTGGAAAMTAVCVLAALVGPAALVAVTTARIVLPTSAPASV